MRTASLMSGSRRRSTIGLSKRRHTAGHRGQHPTASCDKESEAITHLQDARGWVVHLVVEKNGRQLQVRAARCRRGLVDAQLEHVWTDEVRLTYEELRDGLPCRGCGRGFFGGPEWVAILHRTPDEAAAIEGEESEFQRLHPECHAGRWSISGGGINHCARCCAPPPMSPETVDRVAKLLAGVVEDIARRDDELTNRWRDGAHRHATKASPEPAAAPRAPSARELARLRRAANAAGYELVKRD
jgi:hypothetical protein